MRATLLLTTLVGTSSALAIPTHWFGLRVRSHGMGNPHGHGGPGGHGGHYPMMGGSNSTAPAPVPTVISAGSGEGPVGQPTVTASPPHPTGPPAGTGQGGSPSHGPPSSPGHGGPPSGSGHEGPPSDFGHGGSSHGAPANGGKYGPPSGFSGTPDGGFPESSSYNGWKRDTVIKPYQ